MRFMRERTELWTSFTSPGWLNMEFPSCAGNELEDLPSVLILVKIKGLGYLPSFTLEAHKA